MHYPSIPFTHTNQYNTTRIHFSNKKISSINEQLENNPIHIIINDNRKASALYILAKLNNENIQVTIDSGANINCIRPDLVNLTQINPTHNHELSGTDKTPLKLL